MLSNAALTIDEGGTATYTVALRTRPTGRVRIALLRASQAFYFRPRSSFMTFTPANWNIPQTVTLVAFQDDDALDRPAAVTHSAFGGGYDGVPNAVLRVTIADDDEPGIAVSEASLTVDEGGTATYTVALRTRPTRRVRVSLSSNSHGVDFRPAARQLTFTPRNWNIPQTVTLSAPQDDDGLDGAVTVTHAASGGGYGGVPGVALKVTIADDDEAGIAVSRAALAIDEGSTATYTVALRTRPTGNVRISLSSTSHGVEFQPHASPLTFTPVSWNVPQTVTLSAPEDDYALDGAVVVTHVASGGGYDGESATLEVTIADDDEAGIAVSRAALAMNEGDTASYTVALTSRPTGNVRVTLWRTSYDVYFRPAATHLTFTPGNWNVPRTVILVARQDDNALDGAVVVTHVASGGGYDGVPRAVLEVTVADDDEPTLSSLTLEGIAFDKAFNPGRRSYTATVDHTVHAVTIGAAANDDGAALTMPEDDDAQQSGVQVVLDEGVNVIEVQITGGNGRTRTYTVTVTRSLPVITASLTDSPDVQVGRPFTVELRLSAFATTSFRDMRDHAFAVTGGRIAGARRLTRRRTSVDGERHLLSNHWRLSVRPDGVGPVTLSLPASRPCDEPGAICTPSGHRVGNAVDLTVRGPEGVKLALHAPGGPTPESAGQMLFTMRLSEAIDRSVIVCWRTVEATAPAPTDRCPWGPTSARPGSATPGADYAPFSGFFEMGSGQTSQELGVHLFDDSVDDDGETVTLEIAHARIVNDDGSPGVAIDIDTSTAVGTIENRGAIPSAWLLRFGRTVAEQVVDAVRDRVSAPRRPGFAGRVAGHAVDDRACSATEGQPDSAGRCEEGTTRLGWSPAATAAGRGADGMSPGSRALTAQETIAGTSLALSSETAQDGLVSLWIRGAVSRFDGEEDGVALDGEATSVLLGADYAEERWDAGLVLSASRGAGNYRGVDSGGTEASLTGLYPWGRYALGERTSLWGVAGIGAGDLTVTPQAGPALNTDIDLALAALGVRSTLLASGTAGGPGLEAVSDVLGVRTSSEAVEGMAASRAHATRLRVGIRGSWAFLYGTGETGPGTGRGTVRPSLEVGLRHDGGDAETGLGLELGGGLAWSDASLGLTGQVQAQGLVRHSDGALRAEGVSGALRWDPRPSSPIGPSLSLRSGLGATSSGAMDLFGSATPEAVRARGDAPLAPSLEAGLGYGLPAFGGTFVGVPEIGVGLSNDRRTYRLGWRLLPAARHSGPVAWSGPGSFELSVEGARREAAARAPEHAVGVRLNVRF